MPVYNKVTSPYSPGENVSSSCLYE